MKIKILACLALPILVFYSISRAEELMDSGKAFLQGSGKYEWKSKSLTLSENYIKTYDTEAIEGLYQLLESASGFSSWSKAYFALGVIGSVDPSATNFDRFSLVVEGLEEMVKASPDQSVEQKRFLGYLERAYHAVGRHGFENWKPFFEKRLSLAFWGGKYPIKRMSLSGGAGTVTAPLDYMIAAATILGEDEADDWIQELLQKHPYLKDSRMSRIIYDSYIVPDESGYSGKDANLGMYEKCLMAFQSRLGEADVSSVDEITSTNDELHGSDAWRMDNSTGEEKPSTMIPQVEPFSGSQEFKYLVASALFLVMCSLGVIYFRKR